MTARRDRLRVVVVGLSLSSSWGNGHATTWRALLKAFAARGHDVLFLERDVPWYAAHRDLTRPDYCRLEFYDGLAGLRAWDAEMAAADAVIVGSYVPDGIEAGRHVQHVAQGVRAFYDIDTPVTLAALARGDCVYVQAEQIPGYDIYMSFTGGPTLELLMRRYGAPCAAALYCSVDTAIYAPRAAEPRWDLSYLGTYSDDRQPTLQRLLLDVARAAPQRRFCVAGPQYPEGIDWPANVERLSHVPPADHPAFYAASRHTLNVTRADMIRAGHSPSVRLFEAAACATPIISDRWDGIETLFRPGREIALADTAADVLAVLGQPEAARRAMADSARAVVLARHSAAHRAVELETLLRATRRQRAPRQPELAQTDGNAP